MDDDTVRREALKSEAPKMMGRTSQRLREGMAMLHPKPVPKIKVKVAVIEPEVPEMTMVGRMRHFNFDSLGANYWKGHC